MTERQAWLKIAKAWDKAKTNVHSDGKFVAVVLGQGGYGICPCICALQLPFSLSLLMTKKLPPRKFGNFVWRTGAAGARARAAFCRRMAAQCGKKKKAQVPA